MELLNQALISNRPRGLNFSRAKYEIIDKNTFIPYVRSDFKAIIPYEILSNFKFCKDKNPVALIKVITPNYEYLKIKKLMKGSNSLAISLNPANDFNNLKIELLDVKNTSKLQKRSNIPFEGKIPVFSIMPKFTSTHPLSHPNVKSTSPIYLFEYDSKIISRIYLGKKNIIFKKEFELDELACASIGLYYAEGGKTQPSFTNSQPKIINTFLDFLETISNVIRKDVSASINCSPSMVSKKRRLEEFWSYQTGIQNFHNKLHISDNVRSPCGILEINLGSKLIKEVVCSMFNLVFKRNIDTISIGRGLLSGDGSPIQQTKYTVTHHIATDKNYIAFQEKFINKIFKNKVSTIKKINDGKTVLYNDWSTNFEFLVSDFYRYNILNRKKFADRFLGLPSTRIFLKLKSNEIIKGTDTKKKHLIHMEKEGFILQKQVSPKPNRRYELILTERGIETQKRLNDFIKKVYPSYTSEIKEFNQTLEKFSLL